MIRFRSVICLMFALLLVPSAFAGPDDQHSAYGAVAGDPRVLEDAGSCIEATADSDGTTCAVLYGHFFSLLDDAPTNTQRPPDDAEDLAGNFAAPVGYEDRWDLNQLTLWSTPGFVEYKESGEKPILHPEHGLTANVAIDPSVPIMGYWYLSADYDELMKVDDVEGAGPDVGVLPCLTVRMVLQTGRDYLRGEPLAEGSVTKTVISAKAAEEGDGSSAGTTPCPHGEGEIVGPEAVTEFAIELEPVADELIIPESKGYIVHVEWYQYAPGDVDRTDKVYMTQWNLHSGPDALGRVVLPVKDVIWFDSLRAVSFGDQIFVRAEVSSAWGSHDVDPGSLKMTLLDADGKEIPLDGVADPILKYDTSHLGHFTPLVATFPWAYTEDDIPPGTYTIRVEASNWQHLGSAQTTTLITFEEDKPPVILDEEPTPKGEVTERSPLPVAPFLALLAVLGAATARMRRRA